MSKRQTVNEAFDILLDYGPAEDKNTEREEVEAEEKPQKKITKLKMTLWLTDKEGAHATTITYCSIAENAIVIKCYIINISEIQNWCLQNGCLYKK